MDQQNLASYSLGGHVGSCCGGPGQFRSGSQNCRGDIYGCCSTPAGPDYPGMTHEMMAATFRPLSETELVAHEKMRKNYYNMKVHVRLPPPSRSEKIGVNGVL